MMGFDGRKGTFPSIGFIATYRRLLIASELQVLDEERDLRVASGWPLMGYEQDHIPFPSSCVTHRRCASLRLANHDCPERSSEALKFGV